MHVFASAPVLERLLPRLVLLSAPAWLATAVNPVAAGGASFSPARFMDEARAALGPCHPLFDSLAEDHQT
jgi:hypothetical protein